MIKRGTREKLTNVLEKAEGGGHAAAKVKAGVSGSRSPLLKMREWATVQAKELGEA